MKARILIIGANGQLGQSLLKIGNHYPALELKFVDSTECDITQRTQVFDLVKKFDPQYLINAAAYTKVDLAESEPDQAMAVNAFALQNIGQAMEGRKCIHISSDYVYHLEDQFAYREDMDLNPQSVYARSKAQGEIILRRTNCNSIIIRTSWVYSEYGNNFLKTMLRLAETRSEINVVDDQWGSPTYATDLAQLILNIISTDVNGTVPDDAWNQIYNYSNKGKITWYNFAKEIMKLADLDTRVNPIPSALFPTKAKRPPWGVMDIQKIKNAFNCNLIDWKVSLEKCIDILIN